MHRCATPRPVGATVGVHMPRVKFGEIDIANANAPYVGDPIQPQARANLAVMNMVLHHTPDPAATLREAAAALAPGGALLVTELCEHQQGWARENCGDLWLGFPPEQIEAWAKDAGLRELASSYLAQRNGFKLQLRLFRSQSDQAAVTPV